MPFINIHTHHKEKDENTVSIVNQYPKSRFYEGYHSVGIHPWYIDETKLNDDFKRLEQMLLNSNCLAVGECGIDRNIRTNLDLQIEIFKHQIVLSEKYQKPVVIHCVRAYDDIIRLKKEWKPTQPWIIHGFNKKIEVAQPLVKNKIFLSFGKALLSNSAVGSTFANIPFDAFFLETDDAEIMIEEVYTKAIELRSITMDDLKNHLCNQFKTLFLK